MYQRQIDAHRISKSWPTCLIVRSQLEYAHVVLDPYKIKYISYLDKVQRKAARFVEQDYSKYNSLTRMVNEFGWKNLQNRRKDRLTMLYKIKNEIANVPNKASSSFVTILFVSSQPY